MFVVLQVPPRADNAVCEVQNISKTFLLAHDGFPAIHAAAKF
jgi:hypothetical protein